MGEMWRYRMGPDERRTAGLRRGGYDFGTPAAFLADLFREAGGFPPDDRATAQPPRPLKLHATRHTWASMALESGKNIRWVADQLGHADPVLTLRVYSHVLKSEERDLSFAEFGPKRPLLKSKQMNESRNPLKSMVGRQGLEPWTIGLKARCSTN